jgi:hypothetical protein
VNGGTWLKLASFDESISSKKTCLSLETLLFSSIPVFDIVYPNPQKGAE